MDLLANEIEWEAEREENMVQLMDSLQELISAKEADIANEKEITKEVMGVRSELEDGAIAENFDKLVEQKQSIVVIEQELVNDLSEFLIDLQSLLEDVRDRASKTRQTMEGVSRPDTETLTPYDWSDIEEIELMLQQAADNVASVEECISALSQRIDEALVSTAVVLGEDVPLDLAKTAQRAAARSIEKSLSSPDKRIDFDVSCDDSDFELDMESFLELKNKDEKELFTMLAKSVGSATIDGSKAAAFGLKAVFDTVSRSKQIVDEVEKEKESEESSALVASGDGPKNKVVETVKSTATALGTVGKAGSTIAKNITQSESAQVAGESLKKTKKDLFNSLEAAAALGVKFYQTTLNRIEETAERRDKDHTMTNRNDQRTEEREQYPPRPSWFKSTFNRDKQRPEGQETDSPQTPWVNNGPPEEPNPQSVIRNVRGVRGVDDDAQR